MKFAYYGILLASLVLKCDDCRSRVHMHFLYPKLIIGSLSSNIMPHWTTITANGSLVDVHTCGYRDHLGALILLLALPVKAIEYGQIRQIELYCVAIVYEVADRIGALSFISSLLECEAVQVCELRELPDMRQLTNVIIGQVEDFEHRDLGKLSEWHE